MGLHCVPLPALRGHPPGLFYDPHTLQPNIGLPLLLPMCVHLSTPPSKAVPLDSDTDLSEDPEREPAADPE